MSNLLPLANECAMEPSANMASFEKKVSDATSREPCLPPVQNTASHKMLELLDDQLVCCGSRVSKTNIATGNSSEKQKLSPFDATFYSNVSTRHRPSTDDSHCWLWRKLSAGL